MKSKIEIEVFDLEKESAQAKYLIRGYSDITWENEIDDVLKFIKNQLKLVDEEVIGKEKK